MKPRELVEHCIEAYTSFNSKKTTIDAHIELYLTKIDCADEGDGVFIKQVVYGCIRFKKLNKVVLTALYFKHGNEVSREDYHLYMIYSYLTLIRLEDMGVPVFRKFVLAQDSLKMFVWMTFIFNSQTLNKWMKEEWCRIYDEQYVEDELIARLLRNLPEVSDIIERLRELASTCDEDDVREGEEKCKLPTTKVCVLYACASRVSTSCVSTSHGTRLRMNKIYAHTSHQYGHSLPCGLPVTSPCAQ